MNIAENLARNNWRVEDIPSIYEYAMNVAPRPNLHNEIGVILLERAGVQADGLGDGMNVVISARDFDGAEILNWDQEDGPMMPEHSSRLIQLAGDAFARAYGYYEHDWSGGLETIVANRPTLDEYLDSCCSLDGLRVVAQEMGLADIQELVYQHHFVLSDWGASGLPAGTVPAFDQEFGRRFPFSLGLARGLARGREQQEGVLEAARVIERPPARLVEEIRKVIAKEIRSAPAEQLEEARILAADLTGPAWVELPSKVRDELAQAECMQRIAYPSSFNWAPIALLYCFAIERLLCSTFAAELKKFLTELGVNEQTFLKEHALKFEKGLSRGMIGEFVRLMENCIVDPRMAQFMERTPLGHVGRLRDIGGRIRGFNEKYRRMTAHPGDVISGSAVQDIKRFVYESPNGPTESLLSLLANLRIQSSRTLGSLKKG